MLFVMLISDIIIVNLLKDANNIIDKLLRNTYKKFKVNR